MLLLLLLLRFLLPLPDVASYSLVLEDLSLRGPLLGTHLNVL
jgi:hypothetical protein